MDVLPPGDEVGERLGGNRHALPSSHRDREPADLFQVLPGGPSGSVRAFERVQADQAPFIGESFEEVGRPASTDRVATGQVVEADQGMAPEEPADDGRDGRLVRLDAPLRRKGRLVERSILVDHVTGRLDRPGQVDLEDASLAAQVLDEAQHRPGEFDRRQVAQSSECLGHLVDGPGRMARPPEPSLDTADRGGFQQRVEEGQVDKVAAGGRVSPGLVPLVEEALGELEDEVGGERGGDLSFPDLDLDRAVLNGPEEAPEPREVEIVDQALAVGLDHDGEVGHLADDLEEVLGPEPLEPEGGTFGGVGPGHQQGPAGVLAEPEAK